MTLQKTGIAPPTIKTPNPRIAEDINPKMSLVRGQDNVDGNCVIIRRIKEDTSIVVRVDMYMTYSISLKEKMIKLIYKKDQRFENSFHEEPSVNHVAYFLPIFYPSCNKS